MLNLLAVIIIIVIIANTKKKIMNYVTIKNGVASPIERKQLYYKNIIYDPILLNYDAGIDEDSRPSSPNIKTCEFNNFIDWNNLKSINVKFTFYTYNNPNAGNFGNIEFKDKSNNSLFYLRYNGNYRNKLNVGTLNSSAYMNSNVNFLYNKEENKFTRSGSPVYTNTISPKELLTKEIISKITYITINHTTNNEAGRYVLTSLILTAIYE